MLGRPEHDFKVAVFMQSASGTLPAGGTATVTVLVSAKRGAVLPSQVQVSRPRSDPNTTNSSASVSRTVR